MQPPKWVLTVVAWAIMACWIGLQEHRLIRLQSDLRRSLEKIAWLEDKTAVLNRQMGLASRTMTLDHKMDADTSAIDKMQDEVSKVLLKRINLIVVNSTDPGLGMFRADALSELEDAEPTKWKTP